MGIAKGVALGPYEILTHIGAGGMGDVWRARDRRIGRDVAVKVLPEAYGEGDARVERFEQEARAAGALNHPGLVTIFDVGSTEGSPYIVMELLEGQTLRDVLGHSDPAPLPVRRVIDYGIQLAAALAVAHEKGIIHRDLKPENIFITSEGRLKILDFGLAKLAQEATDGSGRRRTARHLTSAGMVVGTPGYMSPEQVRAQPLDHRTDIFALGTVLYEMLSGRSPFERESAVETMHAVLNVEQPSLANGDSAVPPALDAIVAHCLEKNPRERFQSARDLAFQLRMLTQPLASGTEVRTAPAATRPWQRIALAAVALFACVGGAYALYLVRATSPEVRPRTFRQLTFGDGPETFPTFAPDGKSFAYVSSHSGNEDIYVQRVDGRTPSNITADSPDDDSEPAFSPDGSQIAFRSERDGGGIFVMGVTGESVRRLTDFGHNPAWAPDGTRIAFSNAVTEMMPQNHAIDGHLWIVDVRTGERRQVLRARTDFPSDVLQPSWSPHGHRIAFWGVSGDARRDLFTIDPDAPDPKRTLVQVTADPELQWNPVWSPDGKYLYYGGGADGTQNLWRMPMDEESGKPAGAPERVSLPAWISGSYSFAQNGDLIYTTAARSYHLLELPFDAERVTAGPPRTLLGGSEEIQYFALSPDGQSIAFTASGAQEDVFVARADGTKVRQLTNDPARDRGISWAPDGKTLYFYSNRDGSYDVWSIRADGSALTRVTEGPAIYHPYVSPDGRTLAGHEATLVHLDRPIATRVERLPSKIHTPRWSPEGRRLVGADIGDSLYVPGIVVYSLDTRRFEKVFDQGVAPQWLPDGRRIAFFAPGKIGVFDLATRRATMTPFTLPGVDIGDRHVWPRLAKDGSAIYVRQTLVQGDVWIARSGG